MSFVDRVKIGLVLKLGSEEVTIPAGNIKRVSVAAHGHGFSATVEWWMVSQQDASEDKLFAHFIKQEPAEVTLTLARAHAAEGITAEPLVLPGRVTGRRVRERAFKDVKDGPVLHRRYQVRFADAATVLWGQHFPSGIWVEQSLQEVFKAHAPPGVKLAFQWEGTEAKQPLHALGLGAEGNTASFLDFVHWLQAREDAGLFFSPATGEYALRDKKPEGGKPVPMPRRDVATVEVVLPEPGRAQVSVLNSYVEAGTRKKELENAVKVEGVKHEYLLTSPLEGDLTQRATVEGKRHHPAEPELRVRFKRYPSMTLALNGLYEFAAGWSTKLYTQGKQYRLYGLFIEARAKSADAATDLGDADNVYELDVKASLELASDATFRRPAFRAPRWPFLAEGLVVSEVGEDAERTYQAKQDDKTSLEYYRVKLPLWEEKEVLMPYEPHQQPGHFYFPADKGTRVLLAFDFRAVRLERFLAWRPGAKLPKESQGNHLLLGKKPESETSIQHVYQDAKPLMRIQRTSDKDTQLIEVAEGRLKMLVTQKK